MTGDAVVHWLYVFVGCGLVIYGLLGMVRGKIGVRTRHAPLRTYTGIGAYLWSAAFIVMGLLEVGLVENWF